jgi:hypothetical protein
VEVIGCITVEFSIIEGARGSGLRILIKRGAFQDNVCQSIKNIEDSLKPGGFDLKDRLVGVQRVSK